jgi:hypothetical protein
VAEGLEDDLVDRPLRHLGEDDVAQFGEQGTGEAQQTVADEQNDRQCQRCAGPVQRVRRFPSAPAARQWPDDLGTPSASGAQNDMRYAYFPSKRRLAMKVGGSLTLFDTLDYEISGVSQQQGAIPAKKGRSTHPACPSYQAVRDVNETMPLRPLPVRCRPRR